jgi:CspA family cold shock protein
VKGKITRYLSLRRYGFIEVEERDIFFHISNFPPNTLPVQGQMVEFELVETPKGLEALKIQVVEDEVEKESESTE